MGSAVSSDSDQQQQPIGVVDLSAAPDYALEFVLVKVPAKELIRSCTSVSRQWNRILTKKSFWKEKAKTENEGYGQQLDWRRLANLSLKTHQMIVLQRPFLRNFVRDSWDLTKQNADCCVWDTRLRFTGRRKPVYWTNNPHGRTHIEVPPILTDGPKPDPDSGEPVPACIATSHTVYRKNIHIRLADEGLTDELMDVYRPTIVVSELVTNRRDSASHYWMNAHLMDGKSKRSSDVVSDQMKQYVRFHQREEEGWRKVTISFSDYPAGMRYLSIHCNGRDLQHWAGNYGVKMAKFTVKALGQSNGPAVPLQR